ncbi:MAG: hypothetical protein OER87_04120, partial [Gammaproteobacteria bacterium]|nr:hypothetical protein [Gammaproteobacteria bacterium]
IRNFAKLSKTALTSREGARQRVRYVSTMGSQTPKSWSISLNRLFSFCVTRNKSVKYPKFVRFHPEKNAISHLPTRIPGHFRWSTKPGQDLQPVIPAKAGIHYWGLIKLSRA